MFGMSGEHFLILGVVLLFFGPSRLPALGGTFGAAIRNFKGGLAGREDQATNDSKNIQGEKAHERV